MAKKEEIVKSISGDMNKKDWASWKHDVKKFAAIPASFYVVQVLGLLTANNGVFSVEYLVPNAITIGSIMGYIGNQLLNLFSKWQAGEKK